ncbi:MAG: ThuA domain-containing protein [Bacteroidales bacterium]
MKIPLFLFASMLWVCNPLSGQNESGPRQTKILVLAEEEGLHAPFVEAAKDWLKQTGKECHFTVDFIPNADPVNDSFLLAYSIIIQLNYPPYGWPPEAAKAFQNYITQGRGGWIGFHHAALLGEFDGYPLWTWFSEFMGGIRYENYIADFASGLVKNEFPTHPCMQNIPMTFTIDSEEWYAWDRAPGDGVRILASVDETSYRPPSNLKMGFHPVVWTNEKMKARNVYIFMGHHASLFQNPAFTTLFRNSISWTAGNQ